MRRRILFLLLACCCCLWGNAAKGGWREVVNLNREWTYQRGDYPGAERAAYDDSQWEHIGLPHSFSIPYFMSSEFYTGYGWYRKTLPLSREDLRKELYLEFDGVFQEAEIYVNGSLAGYNGDGANIPDFQQPGIPSAVTEYGSTLADRPGEYIPGWGDLARDEGWKGRPWRSGQIIWCGFDHGSIFGPNMAKLGIIDYFRLPKRSWYWYRNEYAHKAPPQWPVEGEPAKLRLEASKTRDIKADGTDDVQLIVTVLDRTGRELSNSPQVRLQVLLGPGEFPTGRSIDFAADSDIRIMDGKAAIAFRSYYAGKTIVQASSPGLGSALLELEFTDAPAYQPGKSWQTESRPYVRYHKGMERETQQRYGKDSPTFATSSAQGHSAGYAADGDTATWWQPAADDSHPSLALDMERTLDVTRIQAMFPRQAIGPCVVEVSTDQAQWNKVAEIDRSAYQWQLDLEHPVRARFVRFSFAAPTTSRIPALAEIEVLGTIAY